VEGGHAAGFGAAEFREDGADLDVFYLAGVEVWVCGEGRFEDLGSESVSELLLRALRRGELYAGEHLVVIGIAEAALFRACDGRTEGGEEDDVVWGLLENVLCPLLYEACHDGRTRRAGKKRDGGGCSPRRWITHDLSKTWAIEMIEENLFWYATIVS